MKGTGGAGRVQYTVEISSDNHVGRGGIEKVGNSVLKKFSLSVRRVEPDGAYTFISLRSL